MSMTNHPNTSSSPQMLKSHDCRARDIKRRLDVIQKKMTDLQELGVPCAFCYVSVRNTGSLFTMGNKAMTRIIEECRDVMLENLSEIQPNKANKRPSDISSDQKEVHMVLPPLSQPLSELSLHELRSLIVGIIKDLGIKWSEAKPPFWPESIPFQYPRAAPEGFQGSWTATLREIVRSIYQFYNYNPDTYYKCLTPAASTLDSSPSSDQARFFATRVSSEEMDLDETGDEIDVGMPYETSIDVNESPSLQRHLLYPPTLATPTHQEQEINEDDDNETISVCSDHEPPTGNYFGYEMAQGDSAQTSPISGRRQSDGSEVSSTPSPQPLNQQPQLLYCNPQLYSQLYPSLQTTPFLLHPNLLMKNSLIYSGQEDSAKKMKSTLPKDSPIPHCKSTLAIPYALSRPLQLSSLNLQASSTLPVSYQPLPSIKIPNEERTNMHTNRSQATPTTPMTVTVQPHEAKNKKSRNHGIYIYTTPSEPLKFMSLDNKKKNSGAGSGKKLPHPDKKMVAMAPVVPPITPETVIMRESEYVRDKDSRRDLNLKSQNISHRATVNTSKTGSRKNQGAMKRRRELVFHWYHSPEHHPSSSPPSTKRMNTASSI